MGLKKIVMLTFWVGFVAGCTPLHPSDCHKTTATGSCSSGRWDDQDEWGAQARGCCLAGGGWRLRGVEVEDEP